MKNTRHRHDYTVQHDEIPLDEYTPQHWYTPQDEYRLKKDYTSWPWTHITVWLHTLGWIHNSKNTHHRRYACLRMNTNHMNNTCHSMKPRCSMHIHHRKNINMCHSIMQLRQKQQISTSYVIKKSTQNKEIVSILFPPFGKSRPHQSTEKSPKIMLLNQSDYSWQTHGVWKSSKPEKLSQFHWLLANPSPLPRAFDREREREKDLW